MRTHTQSINKMFHRGLLMLLLIGAATGLTAQQQFGGFCARVKIEIAQELTLERIGFEATLEVTNNDSLDPLTEFSAELEFIDPSVDPEDPEYDAADKFFVQPPVLELVNRIDGQGIIGPTKKAVVKWFIIPKTETGGTDPNGKPFLVGCRLSCNIRGEPVDDSALLVVPDDIVVKPEPQLEIRYFQPRDVQGDDPFTPEVESPIPFTLGVLVNNAGYGPARSLQIKSQQPKIVENLQGLLIVARLLGARVMDSPLDETSLTVNLGDIPPMQTRKGAWDMLTSLSGEFVEFKASYTHADELGGEETSVIKLLEAHFIVGEVLNDEPGRDRILDFLADVDRDGERIADTLFESDGTILPVNHLQFITVNGYSGPLTFTMDLNSDFEGWGYIRVDDPGQANLKIASIVRSDGRVLNENNYWTSVRYRESDNARLAFLEMMDRVEVDTDYTYTVTYEAPVDDIIPPVTRLRFAGEVTEVNGQFHVNRDTQMYFTAEDESPVSIVYRLNGEDYRPALPFTLREPGTYVMDFFSTDSSNNEESPQTAILVLAADGPGIDTLNVNQTALYLAGSTLSVRPKEASLSLQVADNPVPVEAKLSIYKGVRVHPLVYGVPFSPTPNADLDLMVGGELVDFYKYRINGGEWSTQQPVSTPLPIRGALGPVLVEILGRSARGSYPPASEAIQVGWVVDPAAVDFQVTGLPSHITTAADLLATVNGTGFSLYRWTIDAGYYRAETAPGTSFPLSGLETGPHTLSLIIPEPDDEWDVENPDASFSWTVDPTYGTDMDNLPLVLEESFPDAEGTTIDFVWDGLNTESELLTPGWYTVLVELTDPLGALTHSKRHLRIEQLSGQGQVVAAAETGPRYPHAVGNWIVWQESSSGAWNIQAAPVDSETPPLQITSSVLSQEHPRTDGRYAVWQGRAENGNWDIYLVDLEVPAVIEQVTMTPDTNETRPVIDWPWLVYETRPVDGSSPYQLEAVNLETSETFPVYPGPDDQLFPALEGGRVAWQDFRDPGFGEIYFQDLESGRTLRLSEDNFGQYHPDVEGQWVVWQDNRLGQVEVYGHHLLSGITERLTFGPGNKSRPFLNSGWLLFQEDSLDGLTENFQLMDLDSRRVMPLTRSGRAKESGNLAMNHLVWRQTDSGGPVLRKALLPALQTVFVNNNAISVTEGMSTGYGNAYSLLADWFASAGVERISRFTGAVPEWTEESAFMQDGTPQGTNFSLQAGEFIWVYFPSNEVLDLGLPEGSTVDLPAGISALSYDQFPLGYSAAAMVRDIGADKVRALRMLDADSGFWRSIEVETDGEIMGANFPIPPVAVILIDLREAVSSWEPYTP